MNAEDIYFWWFVWLGIGAAVVVAAAILLIAIIVLARRIASSAAIALKVVGDIEQNTKPIWEINATNGVAEKLLSGAGAIESNVDAIVNALNDSDKNRAA